MTKQRLKKWLCILLSVIMISTNFLSAFAAVDNAVIPEQAEQQVELSQENAEETLQDVVLPEQVEETVLQETPEVHPDASETPEEEPLIVEAALPEEKLSEENIVIVTEGNPEYCEVLIRYNPTKEFLGEVYFEEAILNKEIGTPITTAELDALFPESRIKGVYKNCRYSGGFKYSNPITDADLASEGMIIYLDLESADMYTVSFVSLGYDYPVEPITAKAGTVIDFSEIQPEPVYGYTFEGWFEDPDCTTPLTVLTLGNDVTAFGLWEPVMYEITVKHSPERRDGRTSYLESTIEMPEGSFLNPEYVREALKEYNVYGIYQRCEYNRFRHRFDFSGKITSLEVTKDITVYADLEGAEFATLTYVDPEGPGSGEQNASMKVGETFPLFDIQDTEEYYFRGWFDRDPFDPEAVQLYEITPTSSEESFTVYGKWVKKGNDLTVNFSTDYPYVKEFSQIVIHTDNGQPVSEADIQEALYEYDVKGIYANAKKNWFGRYTYTDEIFGEFEVTEGMNIYADVAVADFYTLTFEMNGHGEQIPDLTDKSGKAVELPAPENEEHFTFDGWYTDPDFIDGPHSDAYVITGDQTLFAKWNAEELTATLKYEPVRRNFRMQWNSVEMPVYYGRAITAGDIEDVLVNKDVKGIYKDFTAGMTGKVIFRDVWTEEDVVEDNITLYIDTEDSSMKTLTLDYGYEDLKDDIELREGTVYPLETPEREGYLFDGWYADPDFTGEWLATVTVTEDMTVYAKWEEIGYEVEMRFLPERAGGKDVFSSLYFNAVKDQPITLEKANEVFNNAYSSYDVKGLYKNYKRSWSLFRGYTYTYTDPWTDADMPEEGLVIYADLADKPVYTLTYETNGIGAEIDSVSAVEGTRIILQTPEGVAGYDFEGWFLDAEYSEGPVEEVTLESDLTVYAKWKERTYEVTFRYAPVRNHGRDEFKSATVYFYEGEGIHAKDPRVIDALSGYAIRGIYYNYDYSRWTGYTYQNPVDINDVVHSDLTVYVNAVEVGTAELTYVNFYGPGSPEVPAEELDRTVTINAGEEYLLETPQEAEGYFFAGYYTDPEEGEPVQSVFAESGENIFVYARWIRRGDNLIIRHSPKRSYFRDRFEEIEVGTIAEQKLTLDDIRHYLEDYDLDVNGIYAGYSYGIFSGYRFTNEITDAFSVSEFPVIYADVQDSVYYTVSYDVQGVGEAPEEDVVKAGTELELPKPAGDENHSFVGWFLDNGAMEVPVSRLVVDSDTVVYAKWLQRYASVTLKHSPQIDWRRWEVTWTEATMPVAYGETVSKEDVSAFLGDFEVFGLYNDYSIIRGFRDAWSEETPVDGDCEIFVDGGSAAYHTITYDANGHGEAPAPQRVKEGEVKLADMEDLEQWGFEGWYDNPECQGNPVADPLLVEMDVTLYANWVELYTITFDYGRKDFADRIVKVKAGDKIPVPQPTEIAEEEVTGWYHLSPENLWDFEEDIPGNDMTLKAVWTDLAHIYYKAAPADTTATVTIGFEKFDRRSGAPSGSMAEPNKEWEFVNWTDENGNVVSEEFAFVPKARGIWPFRQYDSGTYTANFRIAPETRTVHFELNHDAAAGFDKIIGHGFSLSDLPEQHKVVDPRRDDYTFTGWYTEASCRNLWDMTTPVYRDMTLYAGWKANGTATFHYTVNDPKLGYTTIDTDIIDRWTGVPQGVTAVAGEDAEFSCWTNSAGDIVSTNPYFVPSRTGGLILGLYYETDTYTANFLDNSDITVNYKVYEKQVDRGYVTVAQESFAQWTGVPKGSEAVANPGYEFCMWMDADNNPVSYDPLLIPDSDMYGQYKAETYVAFFLPIPEKRNVSFWLTYETGEGIDVEYYMKAKVPSGKSILDEAADFSPEKYSLEPVSPEYPDAKFVGWYTDKECTEKWDLNKPVDENLVLYAVWDHQAQVTFNLNYESSGILGTVLVTKGTLMPDYLIPFAPEREDYTFRGWFKDKNCRHEWDFSEDVVTEDMILYAGWEADGKATFHYVVNDLNLGTVTLESESVNRWTGKPLGSTAKAKGGAKFVNWTNTKGEIVSTNPYFKPSRTGGFIFNLFYEPEVYIANFEEADE